MRRVDHSAHQDVTLLADAPATAGGPGDAVEPVPDRDVPTWLDYRAVSEDLSDDGVAAPADLVAGLRGVVQDAAAHGIDLKIVYTDDPNGPYTQARDLATTLGLEHPGTILVRTPSYVGSTSDSISRYRLEAGQDDAYKEKDPVLAATVFEHSLQKPAPPWGAYAGVLLLVIVLAVVAFVMLIRRRARGA